MEYNFSQIEKKWQQYWRDQEIYKVSEDSRKPKYYVLDMFPYPSGSGLHVGHPLGYIASDIYSRYKRQKGFNVLHPMGFDAFGLPAEQYALETGQHPAHTTAQNIRRYKEQLNRLGFNYDWSREVITSDPDYYKWTQWIFLQLFQSWFDRQSGKARPITDLVTRFDLEGNTGHPAPGDPDLRFNAAEWQLKTEQEKRAVLMLYRLAYLDYAEVWWCEALGTVLANDEVVNGVSERGGHPVERKKMRQWFLRITEYAERLLQSLDRLEWSEAMKEMQRNWIGRSEGARVLFPVQDASFQLEVFTTRPDTLFGVDFIVLAPEHDRVPELTQATQQEEMADYLKYVNSRSERERMAEKKISGCFTGSYALHPLTGVPLPIWVSEYVLAGYGTGAIMAVPSGDDRDHAFARNFGISITNIFGAEYTGEKAVTSKNVRLDNSGFITGLEVSAAASAVLEALERNGSGKRFVNYRLRDAGFSRQRYWGEPFPIVYKGDTPYALDEAEADLPDDLRRLPLELPHIETYTPGPEGSGPLANLSGFVEVRNKRGEILRRETNTMPGYAGSSWYFLRYTDPKNPSRFAGKAATDYWQQVDLYLGGNEHAVGHLLYSRLFTKVLYDLGHIGFEEPFKKMLNQGMIQGSTRFVYRVSGTKQFVSFNLREQYEVEPLRVDVGLVNGLELDTGAFKKWRDDYADADFILENGKYICGAETEKMSKSKYNVVNPDDIVDQYGADTFRMYEMFLGPIELSKPWDTKGIEGVHRFLKKLWRLYMDEQNGWQVNDTPAGEPELKILHRSLRKIEEDIQRFAFNTAVSQLMICVNTLTEMDCHKRAILDPLARAIAPFAPHLAEELWARLNPGAGSVTQSPFPEWEDRYIVESSKMYPVAINGKPRTELEFPLDAEAAAIEASVLNDAVVQKWLDGKTPKKFIYVKGKMINVVV